MNTKIIFGAPGRYYQGPGIIQTLGQLAQAFGEKAAVITDPLVANMLATELTEQLSQNGMSHKIYTLNGDLTLKTANQLASKVSKFQPDMIIATGGGRALDAGKAVAGRLELPVITVPTVASTDSPTSKVYVLYNDEHAISAVEHLTESPAFVLVDTEILSRAPADLLRFGLGDALAKKFEARQCRKAQGNNMFGGRPTLAASALAETCFSVLWEHAENALHVAGTGEPDASFEAVVEANILLAGLGFESGGLSLAHGLTRALPYFPGAEKVPHGYQVAYCLMVQLYLEADGKEDFRQLWNWLPKLGLPRTLEELSVQIPDDPTVLRTAAESALAAPHLRNFERELSADEIVTAMLNVGIKT
ncbi:glycerol dehydrogenase [Buttiauxella selenatireducens]|uniref:Glycerol dehydrogenase n=1 Tax=Buttiauxella selenatireducens TaxID=3073902 RepID=A0ABY9S6L6_9ENTR|nr:glycerol dehydrogenase [Buttiauxella sp. R73]WMY72600.1 glycerol dehydrogenase [Buttiauxella sp. R73]